MELTIIFIYLIYDLSSGGPGETSLMCRSYHKCHIDNRVFLYGQLEYGVLDWTVLCTSFHNMDSLNQLLCGMFPCVSPGS